MKRPRVCYVLSYYSPDYVRTRTLVRALKQIEEFTLFQARNSTRTPWRYFETLGKLIWTRVSHSPDIYILGFRGYELFWPVRLLTLPKPLIYDHMMSPYDSLLNESGVLRKHKLLALLVCLYEKSILQSTDLVLTDTAAHKRYFQELFSLPPSKIVAIPVGADEELFHEKTMASGSQGERSFEILYYGSFLPLHGVDTIIKAAALVRDLPVHFTLIGGNRIDISRYQRMIEQLELANISHLDWVEFESLPARIAASALGLGGPFGDTGQGHRVITSKTFQFLAMAKPVVIGGIGDEYGFVNKLNCLVAAQGNERSLAEAIEWSFHHPAELEQIGKQGHELYQQRYSRAHITEDLRKVLHAQIP